LALLAGTAGARELVTVTRVVDGDTVWLADGRHVRLLGINASELAHDGRPEEPLARKAQVALRKLIAGRPVHLIVGRQPHDHYGRLLARVQLADGREAGVELLRAGLAVAVALPPNLAGLAVRRAAEDEARAHHRGIWGNAYFRPRAASGLHAGETGFYFVRGRVDHTGRSHRYIYLDIGQRFSVMVPIADWHYFADRPRDWLGRSVIVRGWAFALRHGHLGMRIGHPSMIQIVSSRP
jgi:micrococcal nuclease